MLAEWQNKNEKKIKQTVRRDLGDSATAAAAATTIHKTMCSLACAGSQLLIDFYANNQQRRQ